MKVNNFEGGMYIETDGFASDKAEPDLGGTTTFRCPSFLSIWKWHLRLREAVSQLLLDSTATIQNSERLTNACAYRCLICACLSTYQLFPLPWPTSDPVKQWREFVRFRRGESKSRAS
jgi:hypothetical protein